jgi:mono/diheme cytochrome c family protein
MTRVSSYVGATVPALIVLGFFVWFANWIPQTRWEPPERQEIAADMTPVRLAGVGQTIVRQRGCLACHTIEPAIGVEGQGRGPNLANIAARRAQGVAGGPDGLVDYLVQALYEPGAFLVDGYSNIMPVSTGAPAKLGYEEVVAVIDYLQSLGGTPSVKVGDIPRPPREAAREVASIPPSSLGEAASAEVVAMLTDFECVVCHSLEPGVILIGPPFDAARTRQAAAERGMSAEAYVMEAIVSPQVFVKGDYPADAMLQDYGERLTAGQLQSIVTYLLAREGQ